ncbi:MAG: DUF222 domain-containing protein [Rhodoglobus sp.]
MAHNPTPTRTPVLDAAERVNLELRGLLAELAATPALSAGEIASTIAAVETAGRLMDAARVRAAAPLATEPGIPEQLGFTSPVTAVAALCGIKETSARARVRVATGISNDITIAGVPIPATHPRVGSALDAGDLGLDAASLIVTELGSVAGRVEPNILDAAEAIMISRATGVSPDDRGERFATAVSVDFLATEVHQITATIDPDGARPREIRSMRGRAFRLGQQNANGNFPVSGELTPEIGVLLAALIEAQRRSPRFTLITNTTDEDGEDGEDRVDAESGAAQHDDRTPDQRRHDTFAEIITRAATAPDAPQLDGAPVTVLVIATAEDLDPVAEDVFNTAGDPGDPIGTMTDSRIPVTRSTIERFIDAHGYRTATITPTGRVTSISSKQRCFTATQRLAIAARDGARCATLGCTTPHYMLQAHHVVPYRDGGATHVDNGILLCFWHHQQVDTGPWQYRMINGIPHILGPGLYEWTARRPPTKRPQTRATLARTRASTPFSRGR